MALMRLNNQGKALIRSVADQMDLPLDFNLIAKMTGYPTTSVKAALAAQRYHKIPDQESKDKKNNALGPAIRPDNLPEFVWEVCQSTGLEATFFRNIGYKVSEWLLVSPTKQALMIFWGRGDECQGIRAVAPHKLQGISSTQLEARRASRKAREDE